MTIKLEQARVTDHAPIQGGYKLLWMDAPSVAPQVRPGQFVHVLIPHLGEAVLRRPFSVFKAEGNRLAILYKDVGRGTRTLGYLRAGEGVNLIGPLGNGYPEQQPDTYPLLVAGGYGMAALYMKAQRSPSPGVAFFGGRTAGDILCVEEFEALGWEVRVTTNDGSLGVRGVVTDELDRWLARDGVDRKPEVFACGPGAMLEAVSERALRADWPTWISVDSNMGCGVGACLTCVVKIKDGDGWAWKRSCKEGPVFAARDVVWEKAGGVVMKPDLAVNIGGIAMKNPVLVASGTFGYGPEYADLVDLGQLGAIVVKGICLNPTLGNPTPRTAEVASGLLNAIGLPGPGVDGFVKQYMPFLRQHDVPVIVNIWGKTLEEYAEVAARFDEVEGIAGLEVNVSCPNIKEGSALFGTDPDMFRQVLEAVRNATRLPMIPKLAPNVSDIASYARIAEDCGANAISLINSFPAMAVEIKTGRPKLANVTGGLSGPAIRPIAIRLVWQAAQAVTIPVIGMGGITCAADAVEFLMVGASAVSVGTANFTQPDTSIQVIQGLRDELATRGMASIRDLVGTVQV